MDTVNQIVFVDDQSVDIDDQTGDGFQNIDWDNSDFDFSSDDDLIDPDYELSHMFKEASKSQSQSEPDVESESDIAETSKPIENTKQNAAKRQRADTIDVRPKKKNDLCPQCTLKKRLR